MTTTQYNVSVIGVESARSDEYLKYSSEADTCDEVLVVDVDGEEVRVPITGVKTTGMDYRGGVGDGPRDMLAVWADGDEIHAHTVVDGDHYVELYKEGNFGTGEVRHDDDWILEGDIIPDDTAHTDWDPSEAGFTVLWTRE